MLLEDVELVEEERGTVGLDRKLERPELHIADRLAVRLGDPEGEGGIAKLRLPVGDAEARQEGVEILGPIEMGEGVAEARVEDAVERCGIGGAASR